MNAADSTPTPAKPAFVHPEWVQEGMDVWVLWHQEKERPGHDGKGHGVRCTVSIATGDHARVVNVAQKVDQWFPLEDLYVPITAPQARMRG